VVFGAEVYSAAGGADGTEATGGALASTRTVDGRSSRRFTRRQGRSSDNWRRIVLGHDGESSASVEALRGRLGPDG